MGSAEGLVRKEKVLNGEGEFLRENTIGFLETPEA